MEGTCRFSTTRFQTVVGNSGIAGESRNALPAGYTQGMQAGVDKLFDARVIRPAAPEDAPAIARVHVESWRTTYRGIFPQGLLDGLSIEDRARSWNEVLGNSPARFVTL